MWAVFMLFVIPIGGGIPAGVLLAQNCGLDWPLMTLLYFVSDVLLACVFEPIMHLFVFLGQRISFFGKFVAVGRESVKKSTAYYGNKAGPLALVLIAFGVDPMTGRAAAKAAGHGFVSGWLIAIIGDMFYFALIMASTLWLKNVLGDGNLAMMIILVLMIGGPYLIRKIRERLR